MNKETLWGLIWWMIGFIFISIMYEHVGALEVYTNPYEDIRYYDGEKSNCECPNYYSRPSIQFDY